MCSSLFFLLICIKFLNNFYFLCHSLFSSIPLTRSFFLFFFFMCSISPGHNMHFSHYYKIAIRINPIRSTSIAIWHPVSEADGSHTWCGLTRVRLKGTPDHQVFQVDGRLIPWIVLTWVQKQLSHMNKHISHFVWRDWHTGGKSIPKRQQWKSQESDLDAL